MKRSRFNEEPMIAILKEQEAGLGTADLCRKHGITSATFYKWKAKYGGLEVSDARRLKALEDENTRLKKLLAEAMLDNAIFKDVAAPRPAKDRFRSDDGCPPKCIRPLATDRGASKDRRFGRQAQKSEFIREAVDRKIARCDDRAPSAARASDKSRNEQNC
jgi:putative transposase